MEFFSNFLPWWRAKLTEKNCMISSFIWFKGKKYFFKCHKIGQKLARIIPVRQGLWFLMDFIWSYLWGLKMYQYINFIFFFKMAIFFRAEVRTNKILFLFQIVTFGCRRVHFNNKV
jgi:hypothetical protein